MTLVSPILAPAPTRAATWKDHLHSRIVDDWRPGEFDFETLVLTPDLGNPHTTIEPCIREGCDVLLESANLCPTCRKAWHADGGPEVIDRTTWAATPRRRRSITADCMVSGCERSHTAHGLCRTHVVAYRLRHKKPQTDPVYSPATWIADVSPSALGPVPACLVETCFWDAEYGTGLCGTHHRGYSSWRKKRSSGLSSTVSRWFELEIEPAMLAGSAVSFSEKAATPFGLLSEPARSELLFAVQQRDLAGRSQLNPIDLRGTYLGIRRNGVTTLVGKVALGRVTTDQNMNGMLNDLQRYIEDAYREWSGIDDRDPRLIYFSELDIKRTTKVFGRDARVDLRKIENQWVIPSIEGWIRRAPRNFTELNQVQNAWLLADKVLSLRGVPSQSLGRPDMDAIVKAIRERWPHERTQQRHLKGISSVIDFARAEPGLASTWKRIPGAFAFDSVRHAARGTESNLATNVDEPFRFVPQPIIDWLMDHLHLIDRGSSYLTAEARVMLFVHERCGRRTGETTRLLDECISYDDIGSPYLEWTQGKPPWGRGKRLPIHQETHDVIREWQEIKREHGVVSKWLFPSSAGTIDKHFNQAHLGRRLKELLALVTERAPFVGPVEGSEGNLVYFDINVIDPYSFRHAFAQRLADATDEDGRSTTSPDVLQDYMGHKSFQTTMAYYAVTAKRKKRALAAIPPRRLDVRGQVVSVERERDSFGKIAVTLGTCVEPQNVAANGHNCAMGHACESCPFFLVDPFEKDGIVAKRQHLKVQIERLNIIHPTSHMIDHYRARVDDCTKIIDGIDVYIAQMSPDERGVIEDALARMADLRRRATAPRSIDLRQLLSGGAR